MKRLKTVLQKYVADLSVTVVSEDAVCIYHTGPVSADVGRSD